MPHPLRLAACVMVLFLSAAGAFPTRADAFKEFKFYHQDQGGIPGNATSGADFGDALAAGDFNGDGYLDLAIGVPDADIEGVEDAGAVHVLYGSAFGPSTTGVQEWHQNVAGVRGGCEANDQYGESLAAGDFNGDGYDDLAVGIPWEDIHTVTNAGGVNILYGSPSGLTASGNQFWDQNTPGIAGVHAEESDRFGYSLTSGDFNGDGYADLAVGIPYEDLSTANEGAALVLYGSSSGLSAAGNQLWHQDVAGVEGGAEQNDRFGFAVAAGDFDGDGYDDLAVGVEGEAIDTVAGAGAVNVLYGTASGLSATGDQIWYEGISGLFSASGPEENDSFGLALAVGDFDGNGYDDLAIGVPLEDWISNTDSGIVYVIYGTDSGLSGSGSEFWHQGSPDIVGAVEAEDNFGEALAAGDFNGDGYCDLAVAADEEAIGTVTGAGAVNVIFGGAFGLSAVGNQMWHQDTPEVGGSLAEFNDFFGDALAAGDFDGDGAADLAVGVYGENWSDVENAGMVHAFLTGLSRLVYPHVDTTGSWATEICAVNKSGSDVSATFTAFDAEGERVGSPHAVSLAAHGRSVLNVASTFSGASGIKYITCVHDGGDDVSGYTKFTTPGQYRAALPASAAPSSGDLYISHVASDPSWWTGIGLVNLTGLSKTLTLRFNNGTTRTVSLPPHGQSSFLVRDLFGGSAQPALASAVLEDAAGVVGLELFGQGNQLGGIRLTDATTPFLFFPHIHSDAEWWTGLAAYNPHASATTLTITPYSAAGAALSGQSIPVGAKGKYVGLVENLSLPAGTAWIKVTASQPVTGFELFGTNDEKLLAGFTAVNLPRTSGVFPKLEDHGWTGIAFVNPTGSPIEITLTAYDDDGTQVALSSLTLAANAKRVDFAEDLFVGDISSATYVTYTSTGYVAGFQLNGSTDGWLLDGLPGM